MQNSYFMKAFSIETLLLNVSLCDGEIGVTLTYYFVIGCEVFALQLASEAFYEIHMQAGWDRYKYVCVRSRSA